MRINTALLIAALSFPAVALADTPKNDTTKTDTSKNDTSNTSRDTNTSKDTAKVKLTDDELQVMAHYHHLDQMEVDMGKMAQKMSKTASVKDYGKMLVTDHGDSDKKLMAFAKKQGVRIPAEKPTNEAEKQEMKDAQDAMKKLHAAKGAEFDRMFLQMMVQDHEKELAKIDTHIGRVSQPDLQQMLKDTKPVLQKHADTARELQRTSAQASLDTSTPSDQNRNQNQNQNRNQNQNGQAPSQSPTTRQTK